MRALESVTQPGGAFNACGGGTNVFIIPNYRFCAVDLLVTSFHLPKSTLPVLVSTSAGMSTIREVYQHTIAQCYRFFSYDNAVLPTRAPARPGEPDRTQSL